MKDINNASGMNAESYKFMKYNEDIDCIRRRNDQSSVTKLGRMLRNDIRRILVAHLMCNRRLIGRRFQRVIGEWGLNCLQGHMLLSCDIL